MIGALDAARAEWLRIKQELGQVRQPPADPEAAYAKIVEQLRDHPEWTARYGCCGNSVVWPIPALIGAPPPLLAPKTAKQAGPLLRESLASDCKNFCGRVFAEWTEKRTPGGRAYHVMETKERSMPLAIGPDGKPLTRVVGTPSALMPLVKKWTVGNPVTKQPGFYQTSNGRRRKVTRHGVLGSANWRQEMAIRAVVQNPALRPTLELCEITMGIPAGWTAASLPSDGMTKAATTEGAETGEKAVFRFNGGLMAEQESGNAGLTAAVTLSTGKKSSTAIKRRPSAQQQQYYKAITDSDAGLAVAVKAPEMGNTGGTNAGPISQSKGGRMSKGAPPQDTQPADKCPEVEIITEVEREKQAQAMADVELCGFITRRLSPARKILRDLVPCLREARNRFSQPGRRVPMPGKPTWGKWIRQNLGTSDRHVRRLLAGERNPRKGRNKKPELRVETESAAIIFGNKGLGMARKLRDLLPERKGDEQWRSENRNPNSRRHAPFSWPSALGLDGGNDTSACPHHRCICAECSRPLREGAS